MRNLLLVLLAGFWLAGCVQFEAPAFEERPVDASDLAGVWLSDTSVVRLDVEGAEVNWVFLDKTGVSRTPGVVTADAAGRRFLNLDTTKSFDKAWAGDEENPSGRLGWVIFEVRVAADGALLLAHVDVQELAVNPETRDAVVGRDVCANRPILGRDVVNPSFGSCFLIDRRTRKTLDRLTETRGVDPNEDTVVWNRLVRVGRFDHLGDQDDAAEGGGAAAD